MLPFWPFTKWLSEVGFKGSLLVRELLANRISTSFAFDVFVSAHVPINFMRVESARVEYAGDLFRVLATVLVGVSLGLPLFLYSRESVLERATSKM